jgi:hypothetical protein
VKHGFGKFEASILEECENSIFGVKQKFCAWENSKPSTNHLQAWLLKWDASEF